MRRETIHVIIPTIPSRRRWLTALLWQLEHQTVRPNVITTVEDAEGLGPSPRWKRARAGEIVVMLDDDVEVGPNYIARSRAWLRAYEACITWWPLSEAEQRAHAPGVELHSIASGFSVFRGEWLEDIVNHLDHETWTRFTSREMNDGLLISAALWGRSVRMIRPAEGLPFMRERPSLGPVRADVWRPGLRQQVHELQKCFPGWDPFTAPTKIERRPIW